jgi:hypothetical protein
MRGISGLAENLLASQEVDKTDLICHIISELRWKTVAQCHLT